MTMQRDLAILLCGLAAGLVLVEVGPLLDRRSTSSNVTDLLALHADPIISLKDLIHGTFFCIGPPKAMVVTTIKLVLGDYKIDSKADADDPSIWTVAAVDPIAKTLSMYWVDGDRIVLEGVNSIVCGQNLELRVTRSEDEGLKHVTANNVEIRRLGGYSRAEGAQE